MVHHALWDKVKGVETTHEGMMKAATLYQEATGEKPPGTVLRKHTVTLKMAPEMAPEPLSVESLQKHFKYTPEQAEATMADLLGSKHSQQQR
jgi:hypothetical protein